jgi:hypothetical protein
MSKPDSFDELFQRPLDLPDNEAMAARIMQQVVRVERRRKALLVGSGLAGTGVAAGIVLWANVLPAISFGVWPTMVSSLARVGTRLGHFVALEPLPAGFGVWALAVASLVAMGVAAARFSREA